MVYKHQSVPERIREQLSFESIPENSKSQSWCDDVWQTVSFRPPERLPTVMSRVCRISNDDDEWRVKTSAIVAGDTLEMIREIVKTETAQASIDKHG